MARSAPSIHELLGGSSWNCTVTACLFIAGVDQVGRGCLAGPVLAAAVILPNEPYKLRRISGVQDSKVLKAVERERLYEQILSIAVAAGVGLCSHAFIDRYGIAPASRVAMVKAVSRMDLWPEHLLIDAVRLPLLDCPQTSIIDGDALCLSIAAASIVAKVTRDRLMAQASARHPGYGFENHKGYGTPEHHAALVERGPCSIHRLTFRPAFANCSIRELANPNLRLQYTHKDRGSAPEEPATMGLIEAVLIPLPPLTPPTLASGNAAI